MNDSIFLKALRGESVDRIPVWFMRQAGRSLPNYRKIRETHDVLAVTRTPELAAQVSLEAVEALGVDAAILFADIMLLPMAMGIDVRIVEAVGPIIDNPIDTPEKVARLAPFDPAQAAFLAETIKILRGKLQGKLAVPLIGFSGAPFTLASYLIEGRPTRTWTLTKQFMLDHPAAWDDLLTRLSNGIIEYLKFQIHAGVQAVQLFDSWVGCLSPEEYRAHVLPHVRRIFAALAGTGVPRIHFGTNTAAFLADFSSVDCEAVAVDWRIGLAEAKQAIGNKSLQGNLDPQIVLADWETMKKEVDSMLAAIDPKKGYVFSLGHSLPPDADNQKLERLVSYVHAK